MSIGYRDDRSRSSRVSTDDYPKTIDAAAVSPAVHTAGLFNHRQPIYDSGAGGHLMRLSKSTRVGIEQVDAEHALLSDCVEDMYQRWKAGATAPQLQYLLQNLELIAREHFRNEEATMREIGYPVLDVHAEAHQKLLGILQHIRIDHQLGHLHFCDDVVSLVSEWVTDHFESMDVPFGKFNREYQRRPSAERA